MLSNESDDRFLPPRKSLPSFRAQLPRFDRLPVPVDAIAPTDGYQGFGRTEFAARNQCSWYKNTTGLHNGIDFRVPDNTPLYWWGAADATVHGINMIEGFRAGPYNIILKYGEYYVIIGHTSWDKEPPIQVGQVIHPGDLLGWTGDTDIPPSPGEQPDGKKDGNPHLHLEIRPIGQRSTVVNPALFFTFDIFGMLKTRAYKYQRGEGTFSLPWYTMRAIECQ